MSDVPSLADEIERKTVTELQRIMHGVTSRRIGIVPAVASIQTLWDTVAGLVSEETMQLIGVSSTTLQKALNSKDRPDESAVFISATSFATVCRIRERIVVTMGACYTVKVPQSKTLTPPIEDLNPAMWCSVKFKNTCAALSASMRQVL